MEEAGKAKTKIVCGARGPRADLGVRPTKTDKLTLVGPLYSRGELVKQRALWKQQGKTVVFTNGCYDILHPAIYDCWNRLAVWAISSFWR